MNRRCLYFILVVIGPVTSSQAATLEGYWSFDRIKPNQSEVHDDSGNGRHGTLVGAGKTSDDVPPAIGRGRALWCKNPGDVVVLDTFPGILGGTARTISVWIKASSSDHPMGILGYGSGGFRGGPFSLMVTGLTDRNQGKGRLALWNYGNATTQAILSAGVWHHVALVVPMLGYTEPGERRVRFYVDGQWIPIANHAAMAVLSVAQGTVQICNSHKATDRNGFRGMIDDLALFSGELSNDQIRQLARGHQSPRHLVTPRSTAVGLYHSSKTKIWQQDPAVKVFPDDDLEATEIVPWRSSVKVAAAANEYESFQIAVASTHGDQLTLEASNLHGTAGIIAASHINVRRVDYVDVKTPSNPSFREGPTPDPLPNNNVLELGPHETGVFWLTVHVPPNTASGFYDGMLHFTDHNDHVISLPLQLEVFDFELPFQNSAYTSASLHNPYYTTTDRIEVLRRDPGETFATLRRYYLNLIQHRVKDYTHAAIFPDIVITVDKDDRVAIDTSAFDTMISDLTEAGLERFRYPAVGLIGQHKVVDPLMWSFGETRVRVFEDDANQRFSARFLTLFDSVYRPLTKHLKAQGMLKLAVVSLVDEPNYGHAPTLNAIRNIARLFKNIDPEITIRITSPPLPELYGLIDIWEMNANFIERNLAQIRSRQAAGDECAFYNNLVPFIDFPGLRIRTQGWVQWAFGFQGTLSWFRVANWHSDPWDVPNGPRGTGYYGATNLVYPPRDTLSQGPVDSIRWELLREGLEDYEYIQLLSQRIRIAQQDLNNTAVIQQIEKATRALAGVSEVVYGLPRQFRNMEPRTSLDQPYTLDASILQTHRLRIARAIEGLSD